MCRLNVLETHCLRGTIAGYQSMVMTRYAASVWCLSRSCYWLANWDWVAGEYWRVGAWEDRMAFAISLVSCWIAVILCLASFSNLLGDGICVLAHHYPLLWCYGSLLYCCGCRLDRCSCCLHVTMDRCEGLHNRNLVWDAFEFVDKDAHGRGQN